MENLLKEADKDDIVTVFMALQRQCFVLGNNVKNLITQWPTIHPPTTPEDQQRSGHLSETKTSTTTLAVLLNTSAEQATKETKQMI